MKIIGNIKLRELAERNSIVTDGEETIRTWKGRIEVRTTARQVLKDRDYNEQKGIK